MISRRGFFGLLAGALAGRKVAPALPPERLDVIVGTPPLAPTSIYSDFMRQQLLAIAAATGVPYEVLTEDLA